ncbi:hypothetical protein STEG23_007066, partial [Scotinomys teguina]
MGIPGQAVGLWLAPQDLVASPFTVSYWNRDPESLNTCMNIISLIPQQPFRNWETSKFLLKV